MAVGNIEGERRNRAEPAHARRYRVLVMCLKLLAASPTSWKMAPEKLLVTGN